MSKWRAESSYIFRYLGSGVANTLLGFAVIFTLTLTGVSALWANASGYAVGFVTGFILSKKFVFHSNGRFVSESFRYLLAFVVAFSLNLVVLELCLHLASFPPMGAQIVATGTYTFFMYIFTRFLVFTSATL
jgi:putative flippase GtrA